MVNSQIHYYKKRILISFFTFLLWVGLAIAGFLGSIFMERRFPLEKRELFYVPPLNYLEIVSGSYKGFCADIFYARGILAISEEGKEGSAWVDWVQKNFETAVSLDPGLVQSYFFGGIVIARDKGSLKKGIEFLERGLNRNPANWEIPYWIGFGYYQLQDYLKSAEFYEKAAHLPGAPGFLVSIQPMNYYKAGRADLGALYLQGLKNSIKDPGQLKWIEKKLNWLNNIVYLSEKVGRFRAAFGYCPEDLQKLIAVGLINDIPVDPFGGGYYIEREGCKIKSKFDQK